jgi:hypothetical protein
MELIELPETIKKQQKYDKIKLLIAGEVLKVRKFTSLLALDLCHYVAILIENLVKPHHHIDKLKLAFDVITSLFQNLTNQDFEKIKENIEYLLSLGVVKKVPILNKAMHLAYEIIVTIFKKKLLE